MIGVIGPRDINPSACTCVCVLQPEGQPGVIRVVGPRGISSSACTCVCVLQPEGQRDRCDWP